jgi:hypothetical protein
MPLQGPILLVAERPDPTLVDALAGAGAFPILETNPGELATALASLEPAAMILGDPAAAALAEPLECFLAENQLYTPMIARVSGAITLNARAVLPIDADAPPARMVALLRAALRIRTLHASVLRRMAGGEHGAPGLADLDPLDDATILVAGRGGSYPTLVVAFGECTGLLGALSLESAFELLRLREVDGVVIGEGFNRKSVARFLDEIAGDRRFRDLPIATIESVAEADDAERLPNLSHGLGSPAVAVERLLPMVRLRAFAARLRRTSDSLDAQGAIDPDTGLRRYDAFVRDLIGATRDAERRGAALCVARFALEGLSDRRSSLDAARLVSRLIRTTDFGCRDADGAVLVAFTETDQRTAHVVARRIASVLKHTTLAPAQHRRQIEPSITIVAHRTEDTANSLLARVSGRTAVAG